MFKKVKSLLFYTLSVPFCVMLLSCSTEKNPSGEEPPQYNPNPVVKPDVVEEDPDSPETDISIRVDPSADRGKVSELLTGINVVYTNEPDTRWTGEKGAKMKAMLTRMKTGIIRYPGGAIVEFWHWNNPSGLYKKDTWDPAVTPTNPSKYMDLEEYMALIKELGIEPLLGVNISSGKFYYDDITKDVDEAKAMVQHCVEKGYNVKYYFIGNEPYLDGARYRLTPEEYAKIINLFAEAIHSVDKDAQLIANWEKDMDEETHNSLKTLIELAGNNLDFIDFHCYWMGGNVTWNVWKGQLPMASSKKYKDSSYMNDLDNFKKLVTELGYPNIKACSLEWNLGPSREHLPENYPDEFKCALMQGEMMLQFIEGGMAMATFWPLDWNNSDQMRYMLDNNGNERQTVDVFAHFSNYLGQTLISTACSSDGIFSTGVKTSEGKIRIAILNKTGKSLTCGFPGMKKDSFISEITSFYQEVSDGPGYNGTVSPGIFETTEFDMEEKVSAPTIRPYSLTFVTFE